ncbi:MAG TPA: T9SS type A sorting domain-containing protein [Bacteroidia bacterium]|nr:T9SS type A sorting domain-containing protein [Bacteroidia bacterium]
MKKNLLFLFAAALTFSTNVGRAQLINAGFETWTANSLNTSAYDPNLGNGSTGWWDFNGLSSSFTGSSPVSVTRVTDTVHGGTYAARIETVVYTTTSYNYIKAFLKDTNGVIVTGNLTAGLSTKFVSGIPCSARVSQFAVYYQYKPNGSDTAEFFVGMYKYETGVRTLIGGGEYKTTAATGASGWQQAIVPVTYADTATPDTMVITLSASSFYSKPKPGSVLWVDDASVIAPAGILPVFGTETGVKVYPNPASTSINFQINGMNNVATLSVFDITGQKINSIPVHNNLVTVNTQSYNSSLYFYQLLDNSGNLVKSGKFSVVK